MSSGVLTIDDLLNKPQLTGAQAQLGERRLRQRRQQDRQKTQARRQSASVQFRDIPISQPNSPLPNPPLVKEGEEQQAGVSLRERVMQAKAKEQESKTQEDKGASAQAGEEATGTKKWSARALALAFWFLPTMVFFAPAILYIDIHILLRWILGERFFCKLGDEAGLTKMASVTGKLAAGAAKEYRRIIDVIVVLFSNVMFLSAALTLVAVVSAVAGGGAGWKPSAYAGAASGVTAVAAIGAWATGWWAGPIDWLGGLSLWGVSNVLWGVQTGLEIIGQ